MILPDLATDMKCILEMRDVSLCYGSIKALDGINLSIHEGEIHAIVGEHGAGKSSLAKMVANLISPDEGAVFYQNKPYARMSYKETIDAGIRMVFQKIRLNDALTVSENLFIANKKRFQSRFGGFSQKKVDVLTAMFLKENGFDLNPRDSVSNLPLSEKAFLSIVKNLYTPPRVLILDEALEKLSADGLEKVIKALNALKKSGCAILFITHRIDDLYMIADRVSIIRKGKLLLSENVKDLDKISLIKMAYTQFSSLEDQQDHTLEFGNLFKYNEVILKQLPISLIVLGTDHRIKTVNASAREFFCLDDNTSLTELTVESLFGGSPVPAELLEETAASGEIRSMFNIPLQTGKGMYMANIVLYPIYEGALLIGNLFIIEDITERERLRDQVILSEKLASLGLLSAGVAHEINNPLGVISNYLESFRMNKVKPDEREAVFDYLFEQINYISQVIGNLITFSNNQKENKELIILSDEIRELMNLIRFNGKQKHIEIHIREDSEVPVQVLFNRNEFKQVILNLFKNSFEVLSEGGVIAISISREEGREYASILFEDNGPGVPFDDSTDVFLPFKSSKNTNQNYGLGLSLCYNILNRYGGSISLDNQFEDGCRFELKIPVA